MTKSNTTEVDVLAKLYKNTAISWDAAVSLQVNFHTADPGEAGTTASNAPTYTGYLPVTVGRDGAAWSGTNPLSNAALLQFPECTGGSDALTHASTSPLGSTTIIHSGPLNATLNVSNGIQPQFNIGALTVTED